MGEAEEREEHRERHVKLHRKLDELIADFIGDKDNRHVLLSQSSIMDLMHWSYLQTLKEKGEENERSNGQGRDNSSKEGD